jgi:hypothetical protein
LQERQKTRLIKRTATILVIVSLPDFYFQFVANPGSGQINLFKNQDKTPHSWTIFYLSRLFSWSNGRYKAIEPPEAVVALREAGFVADPAPAMVRPRPLMSDKAESALQRKYPIHHEDFESSPW